MISDDLTPLAAEDARILALGTGPIRCHTLKVLVIEDPPGDAVVDELRAEIARRLPGARRWQQRLVPAPGTPAGLAWQDDPDFDIAQHVRAASASEPVDDARLRRILADIMVGELDRDRPLWTIDVVPRLADGRWAIVWKVHHCLADGMAMMRAGSRLLWTEDAPRANRPAPAAAKVTAGTLATVIGHRGLVLREFRRVWRLSPLAAEVGTARAMAFAQCSLDELRALGKAVGPDVTINDVLLAVIAGALRQWREPRHTRMKAQVPVSMHTLDEAAGNRDSFLLVELPVGEDDPIARVRAVSHATRVRKHRHDAQAIYTLRESLSRAPAIVRRALQRLVQGPHEYSLNISNVPGPAGPIHVLGRRVAAVYPFAEIAPHHALRVAAASVSGSLGIGLTADPHAIPDLDVLAAGIAGSVDELRRRLVRAA